MIKKALAVLTKYRLVLIWLAILGVFGYTLLRLQAISNPQPNPDYIQKQQQNQTTKVEIKDSLRTQLEQLVETRVDTQSDKLGSPDPFNP